ncbi:MAG: hypothetical protein CBD18_07220 [Opitutales bacterium TMED158]|nr:MAG: hypothetical protein CBD18_07220 [Opitutales bacterium TMED158]
MIAQSNIGPMAIRHGERKLILDTSGSGGPKTPGAQPTDIAQPWQGRPSSVGQLYHIERDSCEPHDLWDKHPEKAEELQALLKESLWSVRLR